MTHPMSPEELGELQRQYPPQHFRDVLAERVAQPQPAPAEREVLRHENCGEVGSRVAALLGLAPTNERQGKARKLSGPA